MTFRTRVNPLVNALRSRAGKRLRFVADRLDPDHAPRWSGYTFVLDRHSRPIFWEGRRHDGCMLWYLGREEREKAYPIETAGHASGGWAWTKPEDGEIPNADRPRRHVEDLISDAAKITSPRGGIRYQETVDRMAQAGLDLFDAKPTAAQLEQYDRIAAGLDRNTVDPDLESCEDAARPIVFPRIAGKRPDSSEGER